MAAFDSLSVSHGNLGLRGDTIRGLNSGTYSEEYHSYYEVQEPHQFKFGRVRSVHSFSGSKLTIRGFSKSPGLS